MSVPVPSIAGLRGRPEWQFFAVLPKADRTLAVLWWAVLAMRAVLPVVLALAVGALVDAANSGRALGWTVALVGGAFVLLQVLIPVHQALSSNLGDRTAAWLYDRLTQACLRPPGLGHLENAALASDLTVAREFDLGMTGPPLNISMDFIASGLIELMSGLAFALVLGAFAWWAPLVLAGAWLATHWMLRESAVWRDRNTDEVRSAQRDSDYAFQLAVSPEPSKELRLFGLADWVMARFVRHRKTLHALQYEATRLRERPLAWSLVIVLAANALVFWALVDSARQGQLALANLVVFGQCAVGVASIAFGGLNWVLDGAAAPVVAVLKLESTMAPAGALEAGRVLANGRPAREIAFRDVSFAYPGGPQVLDRFTLTIPAGSSLAIVGQNGAGKTTIAKLLCRLYDPQSGTIEVDGTDLRALSVDSWRARITAVFQDFTRYHWSLRENVAPTGAPDDTILTALDTAGASTLAELDTILARGYAGGTDLSGGQWQRVALARVLCAVEQGAGLVLLDEPTAQLDVRGEAEIFERLLKATRGRTTLLISHRFSTVRHADRICVVEHGRVVEMGTHEELMALGGRYRTMFDVQAQRFHLDESEEGMVYDQL